MRFLSSLCSKVFIGLLHFATVRGKNVAIHLSGTRFLPQRMSLGVLGKGLGLFHAFFARDSFRLSNKIRPIPIHRGAGRRLRREGQLFSKIGGTFLR